MAANQDTTPKGPAGQSCPEQWISIAQAAERLASSRRVVTQWAQSGRLGEVKPGQIGRGKGMRVSLRAVEEQMAARKEQIGLRLEREAARKDRLDRVHYAAPLLKISRSNLDWMLALLSTVGEIADETMKVSKIAGEDLRDSHQAVRGITTARNALTRMRERRLQEESREAGVDPKTD